MTAIRTTRLALALLVMIILAGPEAPAEDGAGANLIRDDYVFAGVDGRLVQAGDDKWLFEFESELTDGVGAVQAGGSLELLRSATLEKMMADAKTRVDARYRLWGKVTKFEQKNYVFPVYFLGLRKVDRPEDEETQKDKSRTRQSINAPNDILNIPDDIVARLQTSEVLPAGPPPQRLELKQDRIFANRAGLVVEKDDGSTGLATGRYVFEASGLGQGVEDFSLQLLPCEALEQAIRQTRDLANPVRFNVAGILTRYQDRQYLLLQKATRIYSYGNFGG